jgi:hypothetical protein
MKIYLASSWKNHQIVRNLANLIRKGLPDDVECDDFTDPSQGRFVFSWTEITEDELKLNAKNFLEDERTQKVFKEDVSRIDWADVLIMILPCGKSAHMELGYAAGKGDKEIIVFAPGGFESGEWEVMYGFAQLLTDNLSELFGYLLDLHDGEEEFEMERDGHNGDNGPLYEDSTAVKGNWGV